LPPKFRFSTDINNLSLPEQITSKINEDDFWESMPGKMIKEQVIVNMQKSLDAVFVGITNKTVLTGFKCSKIINTLFTHLKLKENGKKITKVIITNDVETFALCGEDETKVSTNDVENFALCGEDETNFMGHYYIHYKPCIANEQRKDNIWVYDVQYKNDEPHFYEEDNMENFKWVRKRMDKIVQKSKIEEEKIPIAHAEPIDCDYDPMTADHFA